MENYTVFPDRNITDKAPIGQIFTGLDVGTFHEACRWVHQLPYGYNSGRDDLMVLFKEKMGSCTTKHAVIATLAAELEEIDMKIILKAREEGSAVLRNNLSL